MLRHERQRRRRLRGGAALLAIITVALVSLRWNNQPPAVTPVAQAPVEPVPIEIYHINDEQLFALLEGTPAALMKLPSGDSTLLVIKP